MKRSRITGIGQYIPPRVVTNAELEKYMDTSDEWIRERSGIQERHWVDENTSASDLGTEAAKQAIENANLTPEDIDFIIFATLSNDYYFPGGGVLVQKKLEIRLFKPT